MKPLQWSPTMLLRTSKSIVSSSWKLLLSRPHKSWKRTRKFPKVLLWSWESLGKWLGGWPVIKFKKDGEICWEGSIGVQSRQLRTIFTWRVWNISIVWTILHFTIIETNDSKYQYNFLFMFSSNIFVKDRKNASTWWVFFWWQIVISLTVRHKDRHCFEERARFTKHTS